MLDRMGAALKARWSRVWRRGSSERLCLAAAALVLSSCSGQVPSPAPGQGELVAGLRPCPTNQFRQVRCGRPRQGSPGCPSRSSELAVVSTDSHLWQPDPSSLLLDEGLTTLVRSDGGEGECCYSGCAPAPVRERSRIAYEYYRLRCIPAMRQTHGAAGRPGCPPALEFPDDMPRHVAPLDLEGGQALEAEWVSSATPLLPRLEWCCYRSAPAAAIGPL